MNKINFFSKGKYLVIPNFKTPKVYLLVNDKTSSKLSFELYNPFSLRGKIFKKIAKFLCMYFNNYVHIFLPTVKKNRSKFIEFLEKLLNKKLSSSLYISTEKDKIVIQLLSLNKILGYIKYPLNEIGVKRLSNEKNALEILSKKNLGPKVLISEMFNNRNFIFLKDIPGKMGYFQKEEYYLTLSKLKKTSKYRLINHPRIISIKKELINLGLARFEMNLQNAINKSRLEYQLVFEHGDFAPWNLKKTELGLVPFDFEYFIENGIQYFDEIKYHFQYFNLIKSYKGEKLINSIANKLSIREFDIIFFVFLLKELIIKTKNLKPINLETSLIRLMRF